MIISRVSSQRICDMVFCVATQLKVRETTALKVEDAGSYTTTKNKKIQTLLHLNVSTSRLLPTGELRFHTVSAKRKQNHLPVRGKRNLQQIWHCISLYIHYISRGLSACVWAGRSAAVLRIKRQNPCKQEHSF